ncbi:hypothetical protein ACFOEE_00565 [Pseudoalteromonas fenneropenaei]|uniref:Uncharacterized protein n=1 Tax=Pseudoalteromonas fenneropenaei TaxID=1737459 RepID=A0ABV7CCD0_9GAMM
MSFAIRISLQVSVGVRRTDEREYRSNIPDIFGTEKVESKALIGLHIGYRF